MKNYWKGIPMQQTGIDNRLGRAPQVSPGHLCAHARVLFFAPMRARLRMRSPEAEYFPGTDERVPAFLTAWEACRMLRLDTAHGGNERKAMRALRRIVESGRLTPVRLGKYTRYRRDDVLALAAAGN